MRRFSWLSLFCLAGVGLSAGAVELGQLHGSFGSLEIRLAPQGELPQAPGVAPLIPIAGALSEAPNPGDAGQQPTAAAKPALERVALPSQPQDGASQQEGQYRAGLQAFDGGAGGGGGAFFRQYDNPDANYSWYDAHTGQNETQASKIKKALDLALSHPLAAAIKNGLKYNTLYRVDNDARFDDYTVRTTGDDPENTIAEQSQPLVIFKHAALRQLSPEYLAAKLASMWARHLYRDTMPVSAEKTYVEGSVMVRVFQGLTESNGSWWNGPKDRVVTVPGHWDNGRWITQNFETFLHRYFWAQGFQYPNVRQGPYFKDKIMGAQGQPDIDTDGRGRRTLYQRAQSGEITQDAAVAAQQRFDGFVSSERR